MFGIILLIAASVAPDALPLTSVTSGVNENYPSLSPDGLTLLFHSSRDGKRAIWRAAADGSNPQQIFDGGKIGANPAGPVWSPDGKSVVFAMTPSDATSEDDSDIYIMRPDGSGVRRLTHFPGDDSHPTGRVTARGSSSTRPRPRPTSRRRGASSGSTSIAWRPMAATFAATLIASPFAPIRGRRPTAASLLIGG